MRRMLLTVIIVAFAIAGGAGWWWMRATTQVDHDLVRGSGMIEVRQVDVSFEVGGRLLERAVDEGELVDKGQPIGRLDAREYQLLVERAAAAKGGADARYRLVVQGARAQERRTAHGSACPEGPRHLA